jgi:predicted acylesterase/phospholipase RssA
MRIHVVLASGGVRSLAYAGAIAALEANGFKLASVSACSAGTFMASLAAAGKTGRELVDIAEATDVRALAGRRRLPWSRLFWPHAKYVNPGFAEVVEAALGKELTLGELRIPFATAGVDIISRSLLVYSRQTHPAMLVSEAVQIAVAVPLLYEPYQPAGRIVVDAVVASAAPVWLAPAAGDDYPIVLLEPARRLTFGRPKNFIRFISQSIDAGVRARDRVMIDQMPRVTSIEIDCGDVESNDFRLNRRQRSILVAAGADAVKEALRTRGSDLRMATVSGWPPGPAPQAADTHGDTLAQQRGEQLLTAFTRSFSTGTRDTVFVSYSHKDRAMLELFVTHLKPVLKNSHIQIWDDSAIRPGTYWRAEIAAAARAAKVAVLLVSKDFLASDFAMEQEVPALFEARDQAQLSILCVPVTPSNWQVTPLEGLQWAHEPAAPLSTLTDAQRDTALVEISKKISAALSTPSQSRLT